MQNRILMVTGVALVGLMLFASGCEEPPQPLPFNSFFYQIAFDSEAKAEAATQKVVDDALKGAGLESSSVQTYSAEGPLVHLAVRTPLEVTFEQVQEVLKGLDGVQSAEKY